MDLLADLEARGLVQDSTDRDALRARIAEGPIGLYYGCDPSADSLQIGNLIGLLVLRRFADAGHNAIALAGGATGMIGDPGGRSKERNLLDAETLAHNTKRIAQQLKAELEGRFQSTASAYEAAAKEPVPVGLTKQLTEYFKGTKASTRNQKKKQLASKTYPAREVDQPPSEEEKRDKEWLNRLAIFNAINAGNLPEREQPEPPTAIGDIRSGSRTATDHGPQPMSEEAFKKLRQRYEGIARRIR